jgi:hypothetical protein
MTDANSGAVFVGSFPTMADCGHATMPKPLRATNFGVGGDSTQHVLRRRALQEMRCLNPTKVLLVIGANNLGRGDELCGTADGTIAFAISANN